MILIQLKNKAMIEKHSHHVLAMLSSLKLEIMKNTQVLSVFMPMVTVY